MWRVLIADDEMFLREGLKKLIEWEELGFQLAGSCKNGQEILDLIPEIKPSVVILDIQMPILSGLEAAQIISKKWPDIIVIILTAYEEFQYAKKAIEYHVQNYVVKNNVLEELPEILETLNKQLKEKAGDKNKEFLHTLLCDSEQIAWNAQELDIFDWYTQTFPEFRLLLVRGEDMDSKSELEQDMEEIFKEDEKQILNINPREWVMLLKDKNTRDELIEKCSCLCRRYIINEKGIVIGISKVYDKLRSISEAYHKNVQYLNYHFWDWEEANCGIVFAEERYGDRNVDLSSLVDSVLKTIETGNIEKSRKEFETLRINARKSSEEKVRSTYLWLFENCDKICRNYGKNIEEITSIKKEELTRQILRGTGMSEVEKKLYLIIEKITEQFDQRGGKTDIIKMVSHYIEKNYCKKLALNDIAEYAHISPGYLSRLYKQEMGENLFDIINRKRVRKAEEYIKQGEERIGEIAIAVGIEDVAYFSKVFKKYTGFSPKEYRNIVRTRGLPD